MCHYLYTLSLRFPILAGVMFCCVLILVGGKDAFSIQNKIRNYWSKMCTATLILKSVFHQYFSNIKIAIQSSTAQQIKNYSNNSLLPPVVSTIT